jgi:Zn-dependent protease
VGLLGAIAVGVALFGSVVLHELGHALAARAFGIETAHITLYPFGGIAAIKGMPDAPLTELTVAIAGPLVNFVLFAMFLPLWLVFGGSVLATMAGINLIMGVFNLVPAFPMDGGRVLRAVLSVGLGWWKASEVAIAVGRGFALLFLGIGLLAVQPGLALVGLFLWFATGMERRRMAHLRALGWQPAIERIAKVPQAFVPEPVPAVAQRPRWRLDGEARWR